jgi:hypothetical protein
VAAADPHCAATLDTHEVTGLSPASTIFGESVNGATCLPANGPDGGLRLTQ